MSHPDEAPFLPPANEVVGRKCFQFSQVSVILFRRVPYITITHDTLDLTGQARTLLYRALPPLVTSGGQDRKPVQTCSLEDLTVPPMSADIWWLATKACTVAGRAVRILLECFFSS